MNNKFYMHMRAMNIINQNLSGGGSPERGYLPADGINDYAIALDAALGASAAGVVGEVSLIVKTANRTAVFVGVYGHLCDVANAIGTNTESVTAALAYSGGATNSCTIRAWDVNGADSKSFNLAMLTGTGATIGMNRTSAPLLSASAADGGVSLSNGSIAPVATRVADHVVLGARITKALAPANFSALQYISAVVLTRAATTSEVAAYSNTNDARLIWPDDIYAYWVAADAVGTSIPPRVGTVPMTLTGGWSASDLVIT